MNVLHMKYALEVAKWGSLSKAAEALLIAQPNLSRSVKELENELGITIFTRSPKGMTLTPEGEEFIGYASSILKQIDLVDKIYKEGESKKQRFSISAPRASYIAEAFAKFTKALTLDSAEIFYKETNSKRTITNILDREYKLGIIRFAKNYESYFKQMLEEKGLAYEIVAEFSYVVAVSEKSPLAKKESLTFDDLKDYIEIAHADPYVPSVSLSRVVKEELPDNINRRIFIFERASQFDLLSENKDTFMWVSPPPKTLLERYNLVLKKCTENKRIYEDVLIYQKEYKLTALDRQFINELYISKQKHLK